MVWKNEPTGTQRNSKEEDHTMKACIDHQERYSNKRRIQLAVATVVLIMAGFVYLLLPRDSGAEPKTSSPPPAVDKSHT